MTAAYDALIKAVRVGDIERCQVLVTQCDPTAQNNRAIKTASCCGHVEVVKLLLKCGCDASVSDDWAIAVASDNGHVEVVKLLLAYSGDAIVRDSPALIYASEEGHLEVVRLLLEYGCDATARDSLAVIYASGEGHLEVVKLLLEYGSDATAGEHEAIIRASRNGHLEVVKVLAAWSPLSLLSLPKSTWRDVLGTPAQALQALNPDDSDEKKTMVVTYHVNTSDAPFSRLLADAPDDLKPFYLAHLRDM